MKEKEKQLTEEAVRFCADTCMIILENFGIRVVLPYLIAFLKDYYPVTRIFLGFRHFADAAFIPVADTLPGGSSSVHYLSGRALTREQIQHILQDDSQPYLFQGDPFPNAPHGIMRHEDFVSHVRVPLFKLGGATFQAGFCSNIKHAFCNDDALVFQRILSPMESTLKSMFSSGTDGGIVSQQADTLHLLRMCDGLKAVVEDIERAAAAECTVLIGGETGVGKDMVADALHLLSPRSRGPFIKINCGAVSDSLLESELFGHEKGSFTGAVSSRAGYFEAANGGTIFLDEIGELSPRLQAELLRVLDNREILRVGSTRSIPLDIRVIAATNRDLQEMVGRREFRADLLYRLNVFPLNVPPLRQRRMDIPVLTRFFADRMSSRLGLSSPPTISEAEMERLYKHAWAGNIRELKNVVERAIIRAKSGTVCMPLHFDFMQSPRRQSKDATQSAPHESLSDQKLPTMEELGDSYVEWMLSYTAGRITGSGGAAERLGLHPNTVRERARRRKRMKENNTAEII